MSVQRMCRLAELPRASFYRCQPDKQGPDADLELRDTIQRIALEFPSYGRPRISAELRRRGWVVIVIMVEMGLRPYRELLLMGKDQMDLQNRVVHIPDSKTAEGIADMPMTELAWQAFHERIAETPGSKYLFPTPTKRAKRRYITSLKKVWAGTPQRADVRYFSLYELRQTLATRLSAGGLADHFVTQMLWQGDSQVFKRYSQAKLNMMRTALDESRSSCERARSGPWEF